MGVDFVERGFQFCGIEDVLVGPDGVARATVDDVDAVIANRFSETLAAGGKADAVEIGTAF